MHLDHEFCIVFLDSKFTPSIAAFDGFVKSIMFFLPSQPLTTSDGRILLIINFCMF